MFVRWKRRVLSGLRGDPHCFHDGIRVSITPVLVESVRRGARVRQRTIARLAPPIRECCLTDAVVRAGWWYAFLKRIEHHSPEEKLRLSAEVAKRCPPGSADDLRVFLLWQAGRYEPASADERWRILQDLYQRVRPRNRVTLTNVATVDPAELAALFSLSLPIDRDTLLKAYRSKVREVHPDRGGTEDEAKVINLAYARLQRLSYPRAM